VKRRKPKALRKEDMIRIRVTAEQKRVLAEAAEQAGLDVSTWLRVLGLRFDGDPNVPRERFAFLRERLGDGFVAVELRQEDGHPDGPLGKRHSVLTGDLVDEPGEPSRAALDQVLEHFRTRLVEVAP